MLRTIRHKLFAALAGFTLLICLCYTGLALVIAYVTEDMLVERLLQRRAAAITAQVRLHGAPAPPADDLIRAYRRADMLPPVVRERVLAGERRGEIFTDSGRHYHLRTLDLDGSASVGGGRLFLLADVGPLLVVSALIREVGVVLLCVALGLIGLALLLAYLLSRRLVLPLQQLAGEVRRLTPDAPVVLAARGRDDEIGYLARRLAGSFDALHAALAREHAFTRDVSHELRTPLTVMRNTLASAACCPLGLEDVAQLRTGVDEIRNTVDVLFALARAEHIADEVLDLRGCIEDSLLRLLDGGHASEDRLVLVLPDRLQVLGNRHLARVLIDNCLANAMFHGLADAPLRLSFADDILTLANTVDPGQLASMQGFLHGQNLLRRVAAAMDWDLAFYASATAYRVEIRPRRPGGNPPYFT